MTTEPQEWSLIEAYRRTHPTTPLTGTEILVFVRVARFYDLYAAHALTIQKHEKQPVDPVRAMVEYMADEHYTWESERDRASAIKLAEIAHKRGIERGQELAK